MKKVILIAFFIQVVTIAFADYLVTNRKASIKEEPSSQSAVVLQINDATELVLLDNGRQRSGYYRVAYQGNKGWIYRTFVKRIPGNPTTTTTIAVSDEPPIAANGTLEKGYQPKVKATEKLIVHKAYVSCMSTEYNVPSWVYEKVSYSLLQGESPDRPDTYPMDPLYPTLKAKAYVSSGYDHGHLAPAADFKRDPDLYEESFYMTNMSPQHGCFNQKGWCMLESNVRNWAMLNKASEFYIFSGSIIDDNTQDWLCLNNLTVTVPSAFFKIIAERKNGKFINGVAFILPNGDVDGTEVDSNRTTIDEVERVTGLNFFPSLSATEENKVEGKEAAFVLEDLSECPKRNSPCSKVYSGGRTLPENRTKWVCEE